MNIFLIGMPSSGKTTLGRQLAKTLTSVKGKLEFIDLDSRIEVAESMKVSEIFAMKGEDYFRKIESQQLKKIQKDSNVVVATGGGVPCFFDNMDFIKNNGIAIFLDVSPEKLVERMLVSSKNDRPMFDLKSENLLQQITEKYNQRTRFYKQADIIVEGDTDAQTIQWLLEAEFAKK
jgi:shikimate kinase